MTTSHYRYIIRYLQLKILFKMKLWSYSYVVSFISCLHPFEIFGTRGTAIKNRSISYSNNQPNTSCLLQCNTETDIPLMQVSFCGTDYDSYNSEYSTSFSNLCYCECGLMTRYQGTW